MRSCLEVESRPHSAITESSVKSVRWSVHGHATTREDVIINRTIVVENPPTITLAAGVVVSVGAVIAIVAGTVVIIGIIIGVGIGMKLMMDTSVDIKENIDTNIDMMSMFIKL